MWFRSCKGSVSFLKSQCFFLPPPMLGTVLRSFHTYRLPEEVELTAAAEALLAIVHSSSTWQDGDDSLYRGHSFLPPATFLVRSRQSTNYKNIPHVSCGSFGGFSAAIVLSNRAASQRTHWTSDGVCSLSTHDVHSPVSDASTPGSGGPQSDLFCTHPNHCLCPVHTCEGHIHVHMYSPSYVLCSCFCSPSSAHDVPLTDVHPRTHSLLSCVCKRSCFSLSGFQSSSSFSDTWPSFCSRGACVFSQPWGLDVTCVSVSLLHLLPRSPVWKTSWRPLFSSCEGACTVLVKGKGMWRREFAVKPFLLPNRWGEWTLSPAALT